MAVQFTDFSRAPLVDSPFKNLLENVFKGYQLGQMPAKLAEEQKQRQLGNQLKQLEVEHKPKELELNDQQKMLANAIHKKALEHADEKFQLEKDYKTALIQKALQTKVGGSTKANGELANFIVSHPEATQEDIRKAYDEIHSSKIAHEQAITSRSKDLEKGYSFDKLPINDKKQAVALMKGMGVDPVEAVSLLRSGTTPTQYAKSIGMDISTVQPDYAAGEQNIKDAQRASAYLDEIDQLDEHISDGLGKYQNKIFGYSFQQIADAARGESPDEQGKVLAARALLPELNALRLKIAGGNIGIEALKELEHKSLGQLNIIEGLVDNQSYLAAQKYMRKWIEEAGRTRINSLQGFSMLKNRNKKSAESQSNIGKVYNLATNQWEDE